MLTQQQLTSLKLNAIKLLGTPFRNKGRLPEQGIDCYGVALFIWKKLGYEAPDPELLSGQRPDRVEECLEQLATFLVGIPEPEPACLVLFKLPSQVVDHVAIYLGKGQIVQATRGAGVTITRMPRGREVTYMMPKVLR